MKDWMVRLIIAAVLVSAALVLVAHADDRPPTQDPVSATLVANCEGLAMIVVITYADGSVIRITKHQQHGFKTWEEVLAYGDKAGKNALRFDELCGDIES
jgi:hypothetical protein